MVKEKVLIVMDSCIGPTGFANSGTGIAFCLSDKYDVHILGLQSVRDEKVKINMEGSQRTIIQHANLPRGKGRFDFGHRSLPRLLDQLEPEILLTVNDIQMVQHVPNIMCPNSIQMGVIDLPSKKFVSPEAMKQKMEGELRKFKEKFPRETKWIAYCFTPDTEVITPDGIKQVTELNVGDDVYSINKETKDIEIKPIVNTTKMHYEGDLISIEGHKFDFQVTPEHRFFLNDKIIKAKELLKLSKGASRKFPEYNKFIGKEKEWFNFYDYFYDSYIIRGNIGKNETLPITDGWRQNHSDTNYFWETNFGEITDMSLYETDDRYYGKSCSRNQEKIPLRVKWRDFLSLSGWFIAEGNLSQETHRICDTDEKEYTTYSIIISQTIKENREKIFNLLDRMNIKYSIKKSSIKISGRFYYHLFENLFGNRVAQYKHIPKWFFKYDKLENLFESLMDGDGNWDKRENCIGKYGTSSTELANDIAQLSLLLGYKARIYNMDDTGCYNVGISEKEIAPIITKNHIDTIPYKGNVYCITVKDNETLFAGRNKKFNVSMNSPQDGDPPMPQWEFIYRMSDQVVAMSKYGKWVFDKWYNMKVPKIWHGVDTAGFTNTEKPKELKDKFVVGSFHRNQPRKQPVRTMIAFARFAKDKDDVLLHMQMDWNDEFGWPIQYFAQQYRIQNKMVQPQRVGMPREQVAKTYNMWDINLNATAGEGFSLPIIEGFACGLPCLGTNYTTSEELIMDGKPSPRGDLIKVKDMHWQKMDVAAVRRALVDCDDLARSMNMYYYNPDTKIQHGKNAEQWAKKNVSWKVIQPQWEKVVADVLSGDNNEIR